MKTFLAQNQFISNSDAHVPVASGSAAASFSPPSTAAAEAIDHIHEIFFYVRKLMKEPPRFVLDEAAFMAEIEEEPLFIRDGKHLRRWA
jgi:hypothetical protein